MLVTLVAKILKLQVPVKEVIADICEKLTCTDWYRHGNLQNKTLIVIVSIRVEMSDEQIWQVNACNITDKFFRMTPTTKY